MLCRISGYTVVEALINLRCARTALPEYWPLASTRAPEHVGREVSRGIAWLNLCHCVVNTRPFVEVALNRW
jgi:hypothetical protein